MREILFRGKTKDKGKWVYGAYIKDESPDSDGNVLIVDQRKYHFFMQDCLETECVDIVIPETVGQYTGLMDKNGKKIFEGDIVEFGNGSKKSIAFVSYENDRFILVWKINRIFANDILASWCKDVLIVGNVYDNPELLKEVQS